MKQDKIKKIGCMFLSAILLGGVAFATLPNAMSEAAAGDYQNTEVYNFNTKTSPFIYNGDDQKDAQYFTCDNDSSLVVTDNGKGSKKLSTWLSTDYLAGEAMTSGYIKGEHYSHVIPIGTEGYRPKEVSLKVKAVFFNPNSSNTNLHFYPLTVGSSSAYQYSNMLRIDMQAFGAKKVGWSNAGGLLASSKNADGTSPFTLIQETETGVGVKGLEASRYSVIDEASTEYAANAQAIADTEWMNVKFQYDWTTKNQVTVEATWTYVKSSGSTDYAVSYTMSYDAASVNLETFYHFGIRADGGTTPILIDDVQVVSENPEEAENAKAEAVANWGGYDDFSDSVKTSVVWTNQLQEKISGESVYMDGTSEKHTLTSAVWGDGRRPLQMQYTAMNTDSAFKNGSTTVGLRIYLLDYTDATGANHYVAMNIGDYKPTSKTVDVAVSADNAGFTITGDYTGKWQKTSINRFMGTYVNNTMDDPLVYTITYDWSDWDANRNVTLNIVAENTSGTYSQEGGFTCHYDDGLTLPSTLNVGFYNHDGKAYIDDFSIKWDAAPQVLGATLSTSDEDRMPIRFGFDYTFAKEIAATEGMTPVAFGAVLVAGTPDYAVLKQNAATLLDADGTNDVTGHTITKNTIQTTEELPDRYYVTISNSDESSNLGKRISAISYVVMSKNGVETVYYSYSIVNHSPMSVLKAIFNQTYLPNNTENNAITAGSALEVALTSYNEGKEGEAVATLDTIQKAVIKGTTNETQRTLLKQLHFALCK